MIKSRFVHMIVFYKLNLYLLHFLELTMERMEVDIVVDQKFPFDLWRKFKSMFTFIMDEEADSLEEHAKIMREVLSKMGEQEGVFSPFINIKNNAYSVDYYKGLFLLNYF